MKIKALRAAAGNAVNLFTVGDYAKITDTDFDVDTYYRIIEYTRSITNSNDIKITLSDKRGFYPWEGVFDAVKANKEAVRKNKLTDVNRTIRNSLTSYDVLSDVYNTVNLIDSEKVEIVAQAEASINNELYYDNTNTVKIYKQTVTIQTDKESDEIMVGEQSVVTAYISPNVAKQNEIDVSVTANLSIISITESYDSSHEFSFSLPITVEGNAEGNEEITLTSATDSSITKNIAIKVNPPTILILS